MARNLKVLEGICRGWNIVSYQRLVLSNDRLYWIFMASTRRLYAAAFVARERVRRARLQLRGGDDTLVHLPRAAVRRRLRAADLSPALPAWRATFAEGAFARRRQTGFFSASVAQPGSSDPCVTLLRGQLPTPRPRETPRVDLDRADLGWKPNFTRSAWNVVYETLTRVNVTIVVFSEPRCVRFLTPVIRQRHWIRGNLFNA